MSEKALREAMVAWGKSLFERGLTAGASGNISVRLDEGYLCTPTNCCLGFLDAARLSKLDTNGNPVAGDPPTKELPLHFAFYEARPATKAVVHLHSTYATAVSCLADVESDDVLPSMTPYVVMRVGKVPLIPYTRPGSPDVALLIRDKAPDHAGVLLANHGPVVAGVSLEAAVFAIEELEEAAKLAILTRELKVRYLDAAQVAELEAMFKLK
jgi:ribulose-5-phosphate 4-epimerase/fuculose-1-phosphate aldolase